MRVEKSKSRYFIAELIINCLFFVICAAISISIFAHGYVLSTDSRELSMSALKAQNIAEFIKASNGNQDEFIRISGAEFDSDTYYVYYDENWELTQSSTAKYTLSVQFSMNATKLLTSNIAVSNTSNTIIYNLNFDRYMSVLGGVDL